MLRMLITLDDAERRALYRCAKRERREIRQQAAVMIRNELERRGLLLVAEAADDPMPSDEVHRG
jgi:hypothetical protein